ncbi:hypothetical protein ACH5RR_009768 [Cinchona calisaya]|uniref:Uncharacterized protein n=1 Tax=Cinchona calisaya TaxID=153742 RepID=A0ABD3AF47_9GENT
MVTIILGIVLLDHRYWFRSKFDFHKTNLGFPFLLIRRITCFLSFLIVVSVVFSIFNNSVRVVDNFLYCSSSRIVKSYQTEITKLSQHLTHDFCLYPNLSNF